MPVGIFKDKMLKTKMAFVMHKSDELGLSISGSSDVQFECGVPKSHRVNFLFEICLVILLQIYEIQMYNCSWMMSPKVSRLILCLRFVLLSSRKSIHLSDPKSASSLPTICHTSYDDILFPFEMVIWLSIFFFCFIGIFAIALCLSIVSLCSWTSSL